MRLIDRRPCLTIVGRSQAVRSAGAERGGIAGRWDFHAKNEEGSRTLFPPLDRAVAALVDDLDATGLLAETLVIVLGEFGRTPLINKDAGRDHWTDAFTGLFFGAGVRGGLVLGKTDKTASYPITRAYFPSDLGATIYTALGIDPATEIRDIQDRPHTLNRGTVMSPALRLKSSLVWTQSQELGVLTNSASSISLRFAFSSLAVRTRAREDRTR
jgi:hypothetical protein